MDIKTFGVVGAGQMGNGIAQVAAMSGLEVIMSDIAAEFVERGLETIQKNLHRGVEKGKMTVETMMRLPPSMNRSSFKYFKIWIESVHRR